MNEQVNIENLSSKILLFLFSKLKPTKTPPYCNQLRNIDIILLLIDIKHNIYHSCSNSLPWIIFFLMSLSLFFFFSKYNDIS